ncbi:MAG: hypothetical protein J7L95_02430 [Prolixibacteraceae bacterium]|nr:hypothetical protein [Prolixibacteraceae bacterium]
MFEISSPSFYEAGKAYYQAKQEMELADKNLKRQNDLLKNGVGVQKDKEEAVVNFQLYKHDVEVIATSGGNLLVKSGLKPGEQIVTKGGYYLLEQN